MSERPSRLRNAWIVATAATFGEMVIYGAGLIATFGVFLQPVSEALGWGRSVMSGGLLIGTMAAAISYPAIGRLVDRWGPRRVLVIGQLVYAGAVASCALFTPAVGQLYATYVVLGIGFALSGQIAYSKVIAAWFGKSRGFMLGVTIGLGNAVGGALAPQLVRLLVDGAGWQAGHLGVAVAILVLGLPTAMLVQTPPASDAPKGVARQRGAATREAFRRPEFWLLLISTVPGGLAAGAVIAHGIAMLTDRGLSRELATSAISVIALMAVFGRVVCGFLLDRVRTPKIALPFYACVLVGLLMIDHAPSSLLLLSAAIFGLGLAGEGTMAPYFTTRYFGLAGYGEVFGYIYAVVAVSTGIGPLLMGGAFDLLGSYKPLLLVLEAGLVLALVAIAFLGPYTHSAHAPDAATAR